MAKFVIIGAGLTGLSAAYHLEKKGFFDYALFEKESSIGGLCRSKQQDGFTFDFTGHLLHTSDAYFRTMLEELVGLENLNAIERQSFVYSENTYTHYPYQINLYGLSPNTIIDCITGYIERPKTKKAPRTFPEWVETNFGKGFGKHFFYPYQEKIFAYDPHKLSASWTGRFVPSTSLDKIIRGALEKPTSTSVGYNANFLYPKKGGIFSWVKTFADHITKPIHTNFCVKHINLKNKTVTFTNGHCEPFEKLITTIPLDTLLGLIQEKSHTTVQRARTNLLCNSVINFNLGVNHPDVSDKHWIYFPEQQYPFYRIGFPHNFSEHMAPVGYSSLYGEFSHIHKSAAWVNKTLKHAITATKKLLSISDTDIATECIIPISHAYVIYDLWREKHLPKLLNTLQEQDIYSIGRYGEWKYASMQEAVLDGKKIADTLTVIPAKRLHAMESTITVPKMPAISISSEDSRDNKKEIEP
jgi:protoporphyrinogen oxidase